MINFLILGFKSARLQRDQENDKQKTIGSASIFGPRADRRSDIDRQCDFER